MLLASPIIYNKTVFAQDVNGTVSAFSLSDGHKIWKQKLKPDSKFENENGLNAPDLPPMPTAFMLPPVSAVFLLLIMNPALFYGVKT